MQQIIREMKGIKRQNKIEHQVNLLLILHIYFLKLCKNVRRRKIEMFLDLIYLLFCCVIFHYDYVYQVMNIDETTFSQLLLNETKIF